MIMWLFSWIRIITLLSTVFLIILPFLGVNPLKYILYYAWVIFLYVVHRLSIPSTTKSEKYITFPYRYSDIPGLFSRFMIVVFIGLVLYFVAEPLVLFLGASSDDLHKYWVHWLSFILILYIILAS